MGRKKTPGLFLRNGVWHVDKVAYGQRIRGTTGERDLEEAERQLARRIEEVRLAVVYGVRPKHTFADAAAKYLRENMHKRSIADDASRLKKLLPVIGRTPLDRIHDGTLEPYKDLLLAEGKKHKTVNNGLELVRRILNLAARKWRDEHGMTWLETPPLLSMLDLTDTRPPYPLTWEEQTYLMKALPAHLAEMALFKVNTGTREQEVCQLRWDWEIAVPGLDTSVFIVPGAFTKNGEERLVVLNRVAKSVIEAQRAKHDERVFTYKGKPIENMRSTGWRKARVAAAEAYAEATNNSVPWGFAHLRVHDLKHTFGRRLRAAGVSLETRKVLLGHTNGDITTHYSGPELQELIDAANLVCDPHKSPTLTILRARGAVTG